MSEKVKYIQEEYTKLNINSNSNYWFNPNIYPETDKSVPICSVCKEDYKNFKNDEDEEEVIMTHNESCLWYNWFAKKIKTYCPNIKIVKNKKNRKQKITKKE